MINETMIVLWAYIILISLSAFFTVLSGMVEAYIGLPIFAVLCILSLKFLSTEAQVINLFICYILLVYAGYTLFKNDNKREKA
jgi:membrane protein implicated in regulation of membrane protease activity